MQTVPANKKVRIEAALGWLLPFALVFYLGMRGGGYDPVVSLPVGIIAWLCLGAGIVFGVLPRSRLRRPELWAAGLLALFALWTALSALWWTSSDERSVASLVLVLTYLGVFSVALAGIGPDGWRRVLGGVGAAIALLAGVAALSRLQPSWFPSDSIAEFLPDVEGRLSYPLDSWNSLGALVAIGLPLVLVAATDAKRVAIAALASAAVPVMALTLFYTLSRSGVGAAAVAVAVLIGFHHERLRMLPTLLLTGLGSTLLLLLAAGRNELQDGVESAVASQQGDEMLWLTLGACAVVALARVGLARAEREALLPEPEVSPATARRAWVAVAVLAVLAVIALAASGEVGQQWDEFTSSTDPTTGSERLTSASGNGRWQQWGAAIDAMESDPITGIGAGTFEYWWAVNGTIFGYTRYAHSLYLETLGELGSVGFLLLMGWLGCDRRARGAADARALRRAAGSARGRAGRSRRLRGGDGRGLGLAGTGGCCGLPARRRARRSDRARSRKRKRAKPLPRGAGRENRSGSQSQPGRLSWHLPARNQPRRQRPLGSKPGRGRRRRPRRGTQLRRGR